MLNLFDPQTGAPVAIIDASDITDMRTVAVIRFRPRPPEFNAQPFSVGRFHLRGRDAARGSVDRDLSDAGKRFRKLRGFAEMKALLKGFAQRAPDDEIQASRKIAWHRE